MQLKLFILPIKNLQHAEVARSTFLQAHRALAANPASDQTGASAAEARGGGFRGLRGSAIRNS